MVEVLIETSERPALSCELVAARREPSRHLESGQRNGWTREPRLGFRTPGRIAQRPELPNPLRSASAVGPSCCALRQLEVPADRACRRATSLPIQHRRSRSGPACASPRPSGSIGSTSPWENPRIRIREQPYKGKRKRLKSADSGILARACSLRLDETSSRFRSGWDMPIRGSRCAPMCICWTPESGRELLRRGARPAPPR